MIRQRAQQRQARQKAVARGEHAHQRRRQFDVDGGTQQADAGPALQFEVGREGGAKFRDGRVVDRDSRQTATAASCRASAGRPCSNCRRAA